MSHAARVHDAMEDREGESSAPLAPPTASRSPLPVNGAGAAKIDDAWAAVEQAMAARDLAESKVRCAPHGSLKARLRAFSEATHALLLAEGRWAKIKREAGQ